MIKFNFATGVAKLNLKSVFTLSLIVKLIYPMPSDAPPQPGGSGTFPDRLEALRSVAPYYPYSLAPNSHFYWIRFLHTSRS